MTYHQLPQEMSYRLKTRLIDSDCLNIDQAYQSLVTGKISLVSGLGRKSFLELREHLISAGYNMEKFSEFKWWEKIKATSVENYLIDLRRRHIVDAFKLAIETRPNQA